MLRQMLYKSAIAKAIIVANRIVKYSTKIFSGCQMEGDLLSSTCSYFLPATVHHLHFTLRTREMSLNFQPVKILFDIRKAKAKISFWRL
jgi:hypothetical protein